MSLLALLARDGYERIVLVQEYLDARRMGATDIEYAFLRRLRLRNGVQKTTHAARLNDTASIILSEAAKWCGRSIRVLDVGCSSGISTLELHETLSIAGLRVETVGTDLVISGTYVADATVGLLFDSRGDIIQLEAAGFATPWYWRRRDTLHHPLAQARAHLRARRVMRGFRAALTDATSELRVVPVPFTTARVAAARGLSIVEENLTQPRVAGQFDIIRAANILNRVYFNDFELRRMLRCLVLRLVDGGLLLVARTVRHVNHSSLFTMRNGRFTEIAKLNGGSEIAGIVREVA